MASQIEQKLATIKSQSEAYRAELSEHFTKSLHEFSNYRTTTIDHLKQQFQAAEDLILHHPSLNPTSSSQTSKPDAVSPRKRRRLETAQTVRTPPRKALSPLENLPQRPVPRCTRAKKRKETGPTPTTVCVDDVQPHSNAPSASSKRQLKDVEALLAADSAREADVIVLPSSRKQRPKRRRACGCSPSKPHHDKCGCRMRQQLSRALKIKQEKEEALLSSSVGKKVPSCSGARSSPARVRKKSSTLQESARLSSRQHRKSASLSPLHVSKIPNVGDITESDQPEESPSQALPVQTEVSPASARGGVNKPAVQKNEKNSSCGRSAKPLQKNQNRNPFKDVPNRDSDSACVQPSGLKVPCVGNSEEVELCASPASSGMPKIQAIDHDVSLFQGDHEILESASIEKVHSKENEPTRKPKLQSVKRGVSSFSSGVSQESSDEDSPIIKRSRKNPQDRSIKNSTKVPSEMSEDVGKNVIRKKQPSCDGRNNQQSSHPEKRGLIDSGPHPAKQAQISSPTCENEDSPELGESSELTIKDTISAGADEKRTSSPHEEPKVGDLVKKVGESQDVCDEEILNGPTSAKESSNSKDYTSRPTLLTSACDDEKSHVPNYSEPEKTTSKSMGAKDDVFKAPKPRPRKVQVEKFDNREKHKSIFLSNLAPSTTIKDTATAQVQGVTEPLCVANDFVKKPRFSVSQDGKIDEFGLKALSQFVFTPSSVLRHPNGAGPSNIDGSGIKRPRLFKPPTDLRSSLRTPTLSRSALVQKTRTSNRSSILAHTPGARAPSANLIAPVGLDNVPQTPTMINRLGVRSLQSFNPTDELKTPQPVPSLQPNPLFSRPTDSLLKSTSQRTLTFKETHSPGVERSNLRFQATEPKNVSMSLNRFSLLEGSKTKSALRCRIEKVRAKSSVSTLMDGSSPSSLAYPTSPTVQKCESLAQSPRVRPDGVLLSSSVAALVVPEKSYPNLVPRDSLSPQSNVEPELVANEQRTSEDISIAQAHSIAKESTFKFTPDRNNSRDGANTPSHLEQHKPSCGDAPVTKFSPDRNSSRDGASTLSHLEQQKALSGDAAVTSPTSKEQTRNISPVRTVACANSSSAFELQKSKLSSTSLEDTPRVLSDAEEIEKCNTTQTEEISLVSPMGMFSNLVSSVKSFIPTASSLLGVQVKEDPEISEAELAAKRHQADMERREAELLMRRELQRLAKQKETEEKQKRAEARRQALAAVEIKKEEDRKLKEEKRKKKRKEEEEERKKRKAEEDKRKEERRRQVLEKRAFNQGMDAKRREQETKRVRREKAGEGSVASQMPKTSSMKTKIAMGRPGHNNSPVRPGVLRSVKNELEISPRTPQGSKGAARGKIVNVNYVMTPARETLIESSDEEEERRRHKVVPKWAQGPKLSKSASSQPDPDKVFVNVPMCNLKEVFGVGKKYRTRSSSANWARDRVTAQEMMKFKKETHGFDEA